MVVESDKKGVFILNKVQRTWLQNLPRDVYNEWPVTISRIINTGRYNKNDKTIIRIIIELYKQSKNGNRK